MSNFDSIYPLEVYKNVSDAGVQLAEGYLRDGELVGATTLPAFTRATAESIAATRPHWARFEDTDIGPEVRTDDHAHIYIWWARNFGQRVAVQQEHAYDWSGQLIGSAFPFVTVWADSELEIRLADGTDARALAESLGAAAALLDQLEEAARGEGTG